MTESEERSRRVRRKHLELAEHGKPADHSAGAHATTPNGSSSTEAVRRALAAQASCPSARTATGEPCRAGRHVPGSRRPSGPSGDSPLGPDHRPAATAAALPSSGRAHEGLVPRLAVDRSCPDSGRPLPSTSSSPSLCSSCSRAGLLAAQRYRSIGRGLSESGAPPYPNRLCPQAAPGSGPSLCPLGPGNRSRTSRAEDVS